MAAIRLMDMDMDIRLMDMDTDIRITGLESASVTAVGGAADTVIVPSFTGITTTGITGITAANGAGESLRLHAALGRARRIAAMNCRRDSGISTPRGSNKCRARKKPVISKPLATSIADGFSSS